MAKKVIIEILLVPESLDRTSTEIKNEILTEFHDGSLRIPWGLKIKRIEVVKS